VAVSQLPVEGFSWKFLSWTQRTFRKQKVEYAEIVVWLYRCYTIWQYVFNFFLYCVIKNSSHFSSIDVTPFILRRWRIVCAACGTDWSKLGEWVWGRWLWGGVVCLCVCVGIVWLWVEGIECGVSVQQVALWCVCVCVCARVCVWRHCVVVSRGNWMTAVLRNIYCFMKVYRDICSVTLIKTLTILSTVSSTYHHYRSRGINWFLQLILYCSSSQSTCQVCNAVKWETNKNEVITGIMWLSKLPHVSSTTY
jgi:hypothetical protein